MSRPRPLGPDEAFAYTFPSGDPDAAGATYAIVGTAIGWGAARAVAASQLAELPPGSPTQCLVVREGDAGGTIAGFLFFGHG